MPVIRIAALAGGVVLLAALWLGPLPALAASSFSAHMTLHMGVVAVAAPLLTAGIAGRRFDPVRRAPGLFSPVPASIVELVVVWAWHAPALHHAARHTAGVMVVEQSMFLLAGVFVWLSAFGGGSELRGNRLGAGIVALLLTSMHMTLLGALLALTPRPLYAHAAVAAGALTPLGDQHLGGAIMLLVGGAAYLAGGLWLTARLLQDRRVAGENA
ncbi:MAG TPA: cytochrome c oxidase assembly protein [Thermoanaerobaculia bacterium]|nr:cytochrome c oxidase assembly protein [Thermoanaerobaculia bacterium]